MLFRSAILVTFLQSALSSFTHAWLLYFGLLFLIIILFLLTITTAVSFENFFHLPPAVGMMTGLSYLMFFLTDSPFIGSMHATIFFVFCSILFLSASLNQLRKTYH